MRVEVDQSGKVESTQTATVLAFSNRIRFSILIPASVKKQCHKYLKDESRLPKTRHLRLFAAALVLLLENHIQRIDQIIIDTEYRGSESELKLAIKNAFKKANLKHDPDKIAFMRIGKKSNAHILAVEVLRGSDPNKKVSFEEMKNLL